MFMKQKSIKTFLIQFFIICFFITNAQPDSDKIEFLITDFLNKGYDYQIAKKDNLAIVEYDKVIKLDKSNKTAYYNLSLIYANSERQLKAIEIADIALANCSEELNDFYRLKANCLSDLKKYDEALPVYHQALMLEPSDSNLNYNLGYTYFMTKKWESALLYLKEYIQNGDAEEGNYDDALFYIATCYHSLKKYEDAIKYFDKAIDSNQYYTYYFNKVESLLELQQYKEALKTINQAIEINPDKAILYHKRYYVLTTLKRNNEAILDLKKAYQLDPNDGEVLLDMGVINERENNIVQATIFYQKCIDTKQNIAGAYSNLANIYSSNKLMNEKTITYFQKAIAIEPNNASIYYNFGNFYRKSKQYEPAISLYEKAIELKPDFTSAFQNLGVVYVFKKDLEKAQVYLSKAIEIEPNDYEANAQIAVLYFEKTDYKNTEKYVTQALLSSPTQVKDKDLLNKRGISRQILGDYKNALYDYLEIVENYSLAEKKQNAGIYSNIGYCYMEDNQLENSLKYFKEAVGYKLEIDQQIGLFTVQYLLKDIPAFEKSLQKAKTIEKRLNEGFKGIQKLEKEGYFYTEKHKLVLKKIFN